MRVNKQIQRDLKKKEAFTLVELIEVITILTVLAGSVIYFTAGYIGNAQDTAVETKIGTIESALLSYMSNNYNRPPTQEQGLKALVEKPSENPPKKWRKYMDMEDLLDPWGNEINYRYPAEKSEKKYDVWSGGEDLTSEEDDIGNW